MSYRKLVSNLNKRHALVAGVVLLDLVAIFRWVILSSLQRGVPNVVSYANNTPFAQSGPQFSDFYQILFASAQKNPYLHKAIDYPQAALVVVRSLVRFPDSVALAIFLAVSLGMVFGALWWQKRLSTATRLVLLSSFPILYAIDRANLDILAVALLAVAVGCHERFQKLAGLLIGIAGAIKLWPLAFLVPFILRKEYRRVAIVGVLAAGGLTLVGQLVYGGSPFGALTSATRLTPNLTSNFFEHNVSLQALTTIVYSVILGKGGNVSGLAHPVTIVMSGIIGIFLLWNMLRHDNLSKRLLAAALFVILIPNMSFVYRASCLIVPIIANSSQFDDEISSTSWWSVASWVMVLAPTAISYFPNSGTSTDSLIVPVALLCLTLVELRPSKEPAVAIFNRTIQLLGFALIFGIPLIIGLITDHSSADPVSFMVLVSAIIYGVYFAVVRILEKGHQYELARPLSDYRSSLAWTRLLTILVVVAISSELLSNAGILLGHDFTFNRSHWAWLLFSPEWLGFDIMIILVGYLSSGILRYNSAAIVEKKIYNSTASGLLVAMAYPMLVLSVALITVFHLPGQTIPSSVIARIALFEFNGINGTSPVGAFPPLSTLWQLVLFVPALALMANYFKTRRKGLALLVATFLLGGAALRWILSAEFSNSATWYSFVFLPVYDNLDLFALGFMASYWMDKLSEKQERVLVAFSRLRTPSLLALWAAYSYVSYQAVELNNSPYKLLFLIVAPTFVGITIILTLGGSVLRDTRHGLNQERAYRFVLFILGITLVQNLIFSFVQAQVPHYPYLVKLGLSLAEILVLGSMLYVTTWRVTLLVRRLFFSKIYAFLRMINGGARENGAVPSIAIPEAVEISQNRWTRD